MATDPVASAAPEAYQAVITNAGESSPATGVFLDTLQNTSADAMMDGSSETAASSIQGTAGSMTLPNSSSLRASTPKTTNGDAMSRSTSQHPEAGLSMPAEAPSHGAPTRQYLNSKVTATLLEGMKHLAREQPNDPLRILGEYLISKSKEIEGQ